MKRAILFFAPVLLLLLDSCGAALHRDIPKADDHFQRRRLTAVREEVPLPADKTARVLLREEPVAVVSEPAATRTVVPATAVVEEKTAAVPAPVIIQRVPAPPHGDTLTEEEAEEIDEAVLDEAYESERIARSAYHFSFLPIFSLIFFPMLFVGVIGTLIQLSRFKKFEYVTEAGLDYEDRARRTLVISIIVPIVAMLLLVLLVLAFL